MIVAIVLFAIPAFSQIFVPLSSQRTPYSSSLRNINNTGYYSNFYIGNPVQVFQLYISTYTPV